MTEFKVTYHAPFSNHTEIIDADDMEDAELIADLKSVYTNFTVEEYFGDEGKENDG